MRNRFRVLLIAVALAMSVVRYPAASAGAAPSVPIVLTSADGSAFIGTTVDSSDTVSLTFFARSVGAAFTTLAFATPLSSGVSVDSDYPVTLFRVSSPLGKMATTMHIRADFDQHGLTGAAQVSLDIATLDDGSPLEVHFTLDTAMDANNGKQALLMAQAVEFALYIQNWPLVYSWGTGAVQAGMTEQALAARLGDLLPGRPGLVQVLPVGTGAVSFRHSGTAQFAASAVRISYGQTNTSNGAAQRRGATVICSIELEWSDAAWRYSDLTCEPASFTAWITHK